jgi:pimeloyl-ACP methyl ester carboxylesterase
MPGGCARLAQSGMTSRDLLPPRFDEQGRASLPLTQSKVQLPVVAIGGEKGLGARVGQFVSMVAANVESVVLPGCGHFVPDECPEAILEQLDRLNHANGVAKSIRRSIAVR